MNSLRDEMCIKGISSLSTIATQYHEFFTRRDYEWWYQVQPGDIVMDVGTCIGLFTCHALDRGAKKVYAVEPNRELLSTTLTNAMPHLINKKESPVVPINCAIGKNENYAKCIFGNYNKEDIQIRTFKSIVEEFAIKQIDYLKIDAEGAEYDILSEENFEFIKNHVKHIAVEVHLDMVKEGPQMFMEFRNNFLSKFDRNKIKFMDADSEQRTYDDNFIMSKWPLGWGSCWMIYICNKSLP